MADLLAIWTTVFFTMTIYTLLYKENPWYRLAESVYLGVAVGYSVAFDLRYLRDQWGGQWSTSSTMMILYALAILIGLLWYFRFVRKYFFLYRWPLAIIVGTGIGMALRTVIFTQFINQIRAQANLLLWVPGDWLKTMNNIIIAVTVPCVLLYFWFTGGARESGPMKIVERIARYTMMAGFGSAFGYTVLARYSLLIGRSQYLLGITPNPPEAKTAFIAISAILLITLLGWDLFKRKPK